MTKRLLSMLLALAMLMTLTACGEDKKEEPAPTTTTTTTPSSAAPQYPTYYVTATKLNVRREPNTNCEILGQLVYGTAVTVLDVADGWCTIIHEGESAYVSAEFMSLTPPPTTTTTTTSATSSTTTRPSTGTYPDGTVPPLQGGLTEAERSELYAELASIISANGSDYKSVYDYVHDNKTYRSMAEGESIEQMAYKTLKSRSVSCYYFAAFTYLLMQEAGYEVEFVRGLGWQTGTEHCWIMFKEADGWYFMDSLYVRSAKLTAADCREIGYKWNPDIHPEAK